MSGAGGRAIRDVALVVGVVALGTIAFLWLVDDLEPADSSSARSGPIGPYRAEHLVSDIEADAQVWCEPWFGDKKKVRTPGGVELSRTVCADLIVTIETDPGTCPTDSASEGRNWVCVRARTELRDELCQAAWQANPPESNSPSAAMHRWCG